MSLRAKEYAQLLVANVKPIWPDLTSSTIDPRKEVLRSLTIDDSGSGLQPGIPGAYLAACARGGDQSAYDLMLEIGISPGLPRPKKQGGRAQAGMRDFLVYILVAELMAKIEELKIGSNDATEPGTSATDMIREALEAAGLACVDHRKDDSEAPSSRSMEKALRRMWSDPRYRELFDPAWTEADEASVIER